MMVCCAAEFVVGRHHAGELGPSVSTTALLPVRDRLQQPRPPPSSPTMTRSRGLRLGTAGLRQPIAVAMDQPSGGSRDRRGAVKSAGRPVAAGGDLATARSLASLDAAISGIDVSTSRVMSSRLKRRRRISTDDGIRTVTPAIHKVSRF